MEGEAASPPDPAPAEDGDTTPAEDGGAAPAEGESTAPAEDESTAPAEDGGGSGSPSVPAPAEAAPAESDAAATASAGAAPTESAPQVSGGSARPPPPSRRSSPDRQWYLGSQGPPWRSVLSTTPTAPTARFSWRPRSRDQGTDTPGPGAYTPGELRAKACPRFCQRSRPTAEGPSWLRILDGPGPGRYDPLPPGSAPPRDGSQRPGFTLSPRLPILGQNRGPGPAKYGRLEKFGSGAPAASMGRPPRRAPREPPPQTPGPGAYEQSPTAHSKGFSFGRKWLVRRSAPTPGPGAYAGSAEPGLGDALPNVPRWRRPGVTLSWRTPFPQALLGQGPPCTKYDVRPPATAPAR
eukprot:TRINITY_DN5279_c0_g1_i3.p1 TRINITY_DN5279_c0_g1~~TRINITY_DN5279_c0_g1_i3.p1  ORF type:complete len:373 (+),score=69.73 TRINITY_DN5279_c0_g1_i3:69-1121(+)